MFTYKHSNNGSCIGHFAEPTIRRIESMTQSSCHCTDPVPINSPFPDLKDLPLPNITGTQHFVFTQSPYAPELSNPLVFLAPPLYAKRMSIFLCLDSPMIPRSEPQHLLWFFLPSQVSQSQPVPKSCNNSDRFVKSCSAPT